MLVIYLLNEREERDRGAANGRPEELIPFIVCLFVPD